MNPPAIRFLSAEEIKNCITMRDAIPVVRDAFIQLSESEATVPERTHLDIPESAGVSLIMPVYLPRDNRIGVKTVSIFRENRRKNLPTIHALMTIYDSQTGIPLAVLDAEYLTALRTGAASALATDLLSDRQADTAAIFGAGKQGEFQLEGICAVRRIKQAFIFDPGIERAEQFVEKMSDRLGISIRIAESPDELTGADIVCTATTSSDPVFQHKFLEPGVHVNAIGSFKPDFREIPSETVAKSLVIVDQKKACLKEAGDLVIPIKEGVINRAHIFAEIGHIAAGRKEVKKIPGQNTLFKSVGNAVQDLAVASKILKFSEENQIGRQFPL